ncbi:hypothetical protein [Neobacillus sp. NPDC093127]|uniref:hypothetical protein n=1 Tax=Neobacillus sp. NPDC093127 TaxID=3364296 RepID=UPI0038224264
MEDHFSEDVSEMLEKSLSHIHSSLRHLSQTFNMLEMAAMEQDWFSQNNLFIIEKDREVQNDSISEIKRIMEGKRKAFINIIK